MLTDASAFTHDVFADAASGFTHDALADAASGFTHDVFADAASAFTYFRTKVVQLMTGVDSWPLSLFAGDVQVGEGT